MNLRLLALSSLPFACACAGAAPAATTPKPTAGLSVAEPASVESPKKEMSEESARPPHEEKAAPVREAEPLGALPQSCASDSDECVPPEEFSKAACAGRFPAMAIAMFEKSSPWQRLYLKAESLDPVNAYGGPVSSQPIVFGEEVLVLNNETAKSKGGIQVSGASDIDVLRWDGSCATVRREMFVTYMMPEVKNATIKWRYLDSTFQAGLLEAKYIQSRRKSQRKICRSSSSSNPSKACAKAVASLNEAITVAVRGGMSLPTPEKLPLWVADDQVVASAN